MTTEANAAGPSEYCSLMRTGLLRGGIAAAWRTAQASEAAPYFDHDWVIQVSQAYDIVAAYERLQYQMLDSVTLVLVDCP